MKIFQLLPLSVFLLNFEVFVVVNSQQVKEDCLGEIIEDTAITKIDLFNSEVTNNTLHLPGGELRYENVGIVRDRPVDLVVTIVDGDYTDILDVWEDRNKDVSTMNGRKADSEFGNINLQTVKGKPKSGEGNFKFCFRDKETNELTKVDTFRWSVFDLDERGDDKTKKGIGQKEKMIMDITQAYLYQLWPNERESEVKMSCEDGSDIPCAQGIRTVFHSSTAGTSKDNPKNPNEMTDLQKSRSITFTFRDTDCWTFTYDHYCPVEQDHDAVFPLGYNPQYNTGSNADECRGYDGGNFLFSGDADEIINEGECITPAPTVATPSPTIAPTTSSPTNNPTDPPTEGPTASPTVGPIDSPTGSPTEIPTAGPTLLPTDSPSGEPSVSPTDAPTASPTNIHSLTPTTVIPTEEPTLSPSVPPTAAYSGMPSGSPSLHQSNIPSSAPSSGPSMEPTIAPTESPTVAHSGMPSNAPSLDQSAVPSSVVSDEPSMKPTIAPTTAVTDDPTHLEESGQEPTAAPTDPITLPPIISNGEYDDDDIFFPPFCPDDLSLVRQEGVTEIPNNNLSNAVHIVSQDTSTVTVKLNQVWTAPVDGEEATHEMDYIYYAFKENSFEQVCYEETDVPYNAFYDTITIQCFVSKPYALLEICVAEKSANEVLMFPEDNATVPECCHPTFPPETPVVCYTIEIKCKTECVEEQEEQKSNNGSSRRGLLRGSLSGH